MKPVVLIYYHKMDYEYYEWFPYMVVPDTGDIEVINSLISDLTANATVYNEELNRIVKNIHPEGDVHDLLLEHELEDESRLELIRLAKENIEKGDDNWKIGLAFLEAKAAREDAHEKACEKANLDPTKVNFNFWEEGVSRFELHHTVMKEI
tara:strand:+ start:976 stop:1428 length:453 start_codon:yes stop_codon:yes gene_type:complete